MQTSLLTKLLHPIKKLTNRKAKSLSEGTSEQERESDMADSYKDYTDEAEPTVETEENEELSPTVTEPVSEVMPTEQKSNRAHLTSSVPKAARVPQGALTKGEMAEIREIFGDMDDAEIQRLYKRVTK